MTGTEILFAFLKAIASAIGGILGILALLFNFRNRGGSLNKWGVISLWLILASTIITVSLTVQESYCAANETQIQLQNAQKVLFEVSRAIHPIRKFEVTYWVALPMDDLLVNEYVISLSKAKPRETATKKQVVVAPSTDGPEFEDIVGKFIDNKSALWPQNKVVSSLVSGLEFGIFLRKEKINLKEFQPMGGIPKTSDWNSFGVKKNNENSLFYKAKENKLLVMGTQKIDMDSLSSNGRISSVPDLYGAQLLFIPPNSFSDEWYEKIVEVVPLDKTLIEMTRKLKIDAMAIDFGEGRKIWLGTEHFETGAYKGGEPAFSAVLPDTEAKFNELTSLNLKRNDSVK